MSSGWGSVNTVESLKQDTISNKSDIVLGLTYDNVDKLPKIKSSESITSSERKIADKSISQKREGGMQEGDVNPSGVLSGVHFSSKWTKLQEGQPLEKFPLTIASILSQITRAPTIVDQVIEQQRKRDLKMEGFLTSSESSSIDVNPRNKSGITITRYGLPIVQHSYPAAVPGRLLQRIQPSYPRAVPGRFLQRIQPSYPPAVQGRLLPPPVQGKN